MAFYDYIPGKQFNKSSFCSYCDEIGTNMGNQSCAYVLVSENVNTFCSDDTQTGNAIEGFKEQMQGYITVLGSLCYANELDKTAITGIKNYLSNVNEDKLDGTEIVNNIKAAESDYNFNNGMANYWDSCADDAEPWEIVYKGLCWGTARSYRNHANDAWEEKEKWEQKARLLISVDANLLGRFASGKNARALAEKGLEQISTSFDENTGTFKVDDSWVNDLKEFAYDKVVGPDGKVKWDVVEQILSKDGDSISDFEYEMIAYAYLNADTDELGHFMQLCGKENPWKNQVHTLTLDDTKITKIQQQVNNFQKSYLYLEKYGDFTPEEKEKLRNMRGTAVQRYAVLVALGEQKYFYGKKGEEFITFTNSKFGYTENGGLTISYGFGGDEHNKVYTSTMEISEPIFDGVGLFTDKFVAGKLTGNVTGTGETIAQNGVQFVADIATEKIAESLLKGAGKCAPVVGLVYGTLLDIGEAAADASLHNQASAAIEIADTADYLGCTGVIINNGNNFSVVLSEGTETQDRMDNFKKNSQGVDISDALKDPIGAFTKIYNYVDEYMDTKGYGDPSVAELFTN